MLNRILRLSLFFAGLALSSGLSAQSSTPTGGTTDSRPRPETAPAQTNITDPSYRLSPGDTISISVQGEPDLTTAPTISRSGEIRLIYISDDIVITGRTVRETEHFLENLYREKKLLKSPVIRVNIGAYAPREVSVLGAVRTPGTVAFPRDNTSMDLVDVITRAGGFTPIAKEYAVQLTHRTADGKETVQTVDLADVISNRRRQAKDRVDVLVYPGDRIYVPEKMF